MTAHTIIRMGHPTLRLRASDINPDEIGSAALNTLIEDMRETLHVAGGIGLAAPQIGISKRLAVIEIVNTSTRYGEIDAMPFSVFINPVITVLTPDAAGYWEGCLSVPGMMGYVERPQHIRVDYLDPSGTAQRLELNGFLATVMQHEFDHLDGVLYIDRLADTHKLAFEDEYRQFALDHADG